MCRDTKDVKEIICNLIMRYCNTIVYFLTFILKDAKSRSQLYFSLIPERFSKLCTQSLFQTYLKTAQHESFVSF